jgi:hypothetical protein
MSHIFHITPFLLPPSLHFHWLRSSSFRRFFFLLPSFDAISVHSDSPRCLRRLPVSSFAARHALHATATFSPSPELSFPATPSPAQPAIFSFHAFSAVAVIAALIFDIDAGQPGAGAYVLMRAG